MLLEVLLLPRLVLVLVLVLVLGRLRGDRGV